MIASCGDAANPVWQVSGEQFFLCTVWCDHDDLTGIDVGGAEKLSGIATNKIALAFVGPRVQNRSANVVVEDEVKAT